MERLGASPRGRHVQPKAEKGDARGPVEELGTRLRRCLGPEQARCTEDGDDIDQRIEHHADSTHDDKLHRDGCSADKKLGEKSKKEQRGLDVEGLHQYALQQGSARAG